MWGKILHQRSGVMLDKRGVPFYVRSTDGRSLAAGVTKRHAWESGGRLMLVCTPRISSLLTMPGVAALFPAGVAEEKEQEPRPCFAQLCKELGDVSERTRQLQSAGFPAREQKPVGRYQRPVSWCVTGNAIYVDWLRLAAQRFVAQAQSQ